MSSSKVNKWKSKRINHISEVPSASEIYISKQEHELKFKRDKTNIVASRLATILNKHNLNSQRSGSQSYRQLNESRNPVIFSKAVKPPISNSKRHAVNILPSQILG